MAVESIFYSVSGISCRGALIWDESGKAPRPLLLIAPTWRGVSKAAIDTAQLLAPEGYVVFVADMFGEGNGPVGTDARSAISADALPSDSDSVASTCSSSRARALTCRLSSPCTAHW